MHHTSTAGLAFISSLFYMSIFPVFLSCIPSHIFLVYYSLALASILMYFVRFSLIRSVLYVILTRVPFYCRNQFYQFFRLMNQIFLFCSIKIVWKPILTSAPFIFFLLCYLPNDRHTCFGTSFCSFCVSLFFKIRIFT